MIAQGVEAGRSRARHARRRWSCSRGVRDALPDAYPVLSAGGIADAADVRHAPRRRGRGGGVRHALPDERGERRPRAYKARLVEARETVLTELFGAGWPAPHRVVANEATARWLRDDPRGPGWVRGAPPGRPPRSSRGCPCRCSCAWPGPRAPAGRSSAPPRPRWTARRTSSKPGPCTPGVHRPHRRRPPGGRARPRADALTRPRRKKRPRPSQTGSDVRPGRRLLASSPSPA